ncbi:hypothetical protein [Arthrobacter oryzae]|uniref:hypothetical protein n=1 Tax=Arthrobacter oryzae TaxID=409290 RepID=UPI001606C394|nr:hypothetical protein [Arthrobacter oryzae]
MTVLNMLDVIIGPPGMITTGAGENEAVERNFPKNHDLLLNSVMKDLSKLFTINCIEDCGEDHVRTPVGAPGRAACKPDFLDWIEG